MSTDKTSTPEATPVDEHIVENPEAAAGANTAVDPRLLIREEGFGGYLTEFKRKIRGGELGAVPVVCGLIIIWAIFQGTTGRFLEPDNLSNIAQYIVGPGLIATGIVFVLLLGEIDLSVSSLAGLTAALAAVMAVKNGMNEAQAVILALLAAAAIGALQGFFFAKIGVPAFVVTLAGFLGWSGLQLQVLGNTLSLNNIADGVIYSLNNTYFSNVAWANTAAIVAVAVHALSQLSDRQPAQGRRPAVPPAERDRAALRCRRGARLRYRGRLQPGARFAARHHDLPADRGDLQLRAAPHPLRPADLRRRRWHRGRPPCRYQRRLDPHLGVHHLRVPRGPRRSVHRLAVRRRGQHPRRRQRPDDVHRGGRHRWHQPLRRPGHPWSAVLGILVIQSIITGLYMGGSSTQAVQYMITGVVLLAAVVLDSVSRRTQKSAYRA